MLAACKKLVSKFARLTKTEHRPIDALNRLIAAQKKEMEDKTDAGNMSTAQKDMYNRTIEFLESQISAVMNTDAETAAKNVKDAYNARLKQHKARAKAASRQMDNAFKFIDEVFGDGQEMLILVTELTQNFHTAKFISNFGCDEYFKHNKSLLFYERDKEISDAIAELDLDMDLD